jgi:hypothetical protein
LFRRSALLWAVSAVAVAIVWGAPLVAAPPGVAGHHGGRPTRLVTPPLFVEEAHLFTCSALNLHPFKVVVDIQVFDQTGTQRCGVGPRELAPGEAAVQKCNSDILTEFEPLRYCQILYRGRRGLVLGTAQFDPPSQDNGGIGPAVVAVEVP